MNKSAVLPTCNNCTRVYNLKGTRPGQRQQHPLLLDCGHSYCVTCLIKLAVRNHEKEILCPACLTLTPLEYGKDSVHNLPVDLFTLGLVSSNKSQVVDVNMTSIWRSAVKKGRLAANFKEGTPPVTVTSKNKAKTRKKKMCSDCGKRPSSCRCNKCRSNWCGVCFDRVHRYSPVLMTHQAVPLYLEGLMENGCTDHKGRVFELWCTDCEQPMCSLCCIKNHNGHKITEMFKKNIELIKDTGLLIENADMILSSFKKSAQIVTDACQDVEMDIIRTGTEIGRLFQQLHGMLQTCEMRIQWELQDRGAGGLQSLKSFQLELDKNFKFLNGAMQGALKLVKCKPTKRYLGCVMDVRKVTEILTSAVEMPCCAVQNNAKKSSYFTFDADETILKIQELVEGLTLTSTTDKQFTMKLHTEVSLDLAQSKTEMVFVTNVKTPGDFIIQRCADRNRLETLSQSVNRYCRNVEGRNQKLTSVQPGDHCFAYFSHDMMWYRARVKAVYPSDEPTSYPDKEPTDTNRDDPIVDVEYIDYGNHEKIPLSKLRHIEPNYFKIPDLSVRCGLIGVVPFNKNCKWSVESIKAFLRMTENKPILMVTHTVEEGKAYVDLQKPANNAIQDDQPVSIKDELVFLELARYFSNSSTTIPSILPQTRERRYLNCDPLHVNDQVHIAVTHVVSPLNFCFHVIGCETEYLATMMEEIQLMFNVDNGDVWNVYCPRIGMVCVARFSTDNMWYRAIVQDTPGNLQVTVYYVDYGNTETIDDREIKKIPDAFLKLPPQARKCSLADIGYTGDIPQDTLLQFHEMVLHRAFTISVHDSTETTVSVVMHEMGDQTCINSILVKQGLAQTTGPCSAGGVRLTDDNATFSKTVQDVMEQLFDSASGQPTVNPVVPYMPVIVTCIESPGLFYTQLATAGIDGLDGLMMSLLETYKDTEPDPESDWQVDDMCSAYYPPTKVWSRATIKQLLPESKYRVFYIDYGNTGYLNLDQLRQLGEEYQQLPAFSIRCHLSTIRPAGSSESWSHTATDRMEEILTLIQAYLQKKDDIVDNSLPVDLLFEKTPAGTINLPSRPVKAVSTDIQLYSMSDTLVLEGLALLTQHDSRRQQLRQKFFERVSTPEGTDETEGTLSSTMSRPDERPSSPKTRPSPETLHDLGRLPEAPRDLDCLPEAPRDLDRLPEAPRDLDRLPEATRDLDRLPEATRDLDRRPEAPRDLDRLPEATRDLDRLPEAPHVPQCSSSPSSPAEMLSNVSEPSLSPVATARDAAPTDPVLVVATTDSDDSTEEEPPSPPSHGTKTGATSPLASRDSGLETSDLVNGYLPIEEPSSKLIDFIPTFVDPDTGVVYGQQVLSLTDTSFEDMMQSMNNALDLYPAEGGAEHIWTVDETCSARFSADNLWYRAVVSEILPTGGIKVNYVDFGNSEVVSASQIHAKVASPDRPVQCLSCSLFSLVRPLSLAAIGWLSEHIISQACTLIIRAPFTPHEPVEGVILTHSGQDVRHFLVGQRWAEWADSETSGDTGNHPAERLSYVYSEDVLPENSQPISVSMSHVNSPDRIYITHSWNDRCDNPHSTEILKQFKVIAEISNNTEDLVPVGKNLITKGLCCVAQYRGDGSWYRAQVLQCDASSNVLVFYMDYGTSEMVSSHKICYMPQTVKTLPAQTIRCQLAGVKPPVEPGQLVLYENTRWPLESIQLLSEVANYEFVGLIVERSTHPLTVELFYRDPSSDQLLSIADLLINRGLADRVSS